MVSASNQRMIVAYWRQYFFIEYRNLPPETIGVPPLARAIIPSGIARKAAGELQGLRPAGQSSAAPGALPLLFVRVSIPPLATKPQFNAVRQVVIQGTLRFSCRTDCFLLVFTYKIKINYV